MGVCVGKNLGRIQLVNEERPIESHAEQKAKGIILAGHGSAFLRSTLNAYESIVPNRLVNCPFKLGNPHYV